MFALKYKQESERSHLCVFININARLGGEWLTWLNNNSLFKFNLDTRINLLTHATSFNYSHSRVTFSSF